MKSFFEFRRNLAKDLLKYADKKVNIKKGTRLRVEDFKDDKIAILTKGLIRYNYIMSNNKEFLFGCYREYTLLIIGELFDDNTGEGNFLDVFQVDICEDSEVYLISRKILKELILVNKELLIKLANYYGLFYQKKFYQMRDIQMFNIEDAILSLSIRAYNTYGEVLNKKNIVNHKILNKNLAKCLACSEETVSRAITKLKKERVISKINGLIVIENIEAVKERLGCNFCKQSICYF